MYAPVKSVQRQGSPNEEAMLLYSTYMATRWKIEIEKKIFGQAKGRLMETDDGVGEPIRGMNCGETKEQAKATLALLGSPQRLSTC